MIDKILSILGKRYLLEVESLDDNTGFKITVKDKETCTKARRIISVEELMVLNDDTILSRAVKECILVLKGVLYKEK